MIRISYTTWFIYYPLIARSSSLELIELCYIIIYTVVGNKIKLFTLLGTSR